MKSAGLGPDPHVGLTDFPASSLKTPRATTFGDSMLLGSARHHASSGDASEAGQYWHLFPLSLVADALLASHHFRSESDMRANSAPRVARVHHLPAVRPRRPLYALSFLFKEHQ